MTDNKVYSVLDVLTDQWQPVDCQAFREAWFEAPFVGFLVSLPIGCVISILAENSLNGLVVVGLSFAVIILGAIPYFVIGAPVAWIALRISVLPWHRVFAAALGGAIATFITTLSAAIVSYAILSREHVIIGAFWTLGAFYAPSWLAILAIRYDAIIRRRAAYDQNFPMKGA